MYLPVIVDSSGKIADGYSSLVSSEKNVKFEIINKQFNNSITNLILHVYGNSSSFSLSSYVKIHVSSNIAGERNMFGPLSMNSYLLDSIGSLTMYYHFSMKSNYCEGNRDVFKSQSISPGWGIAEISDLIACS